MNGIRIKAHGARAVACARLARQLMTSVGYAALLSSTSAIPAFANPVGANVVAGSATVTSSSTTLTIDQKTKVVILDWSSFNIARGETTQFRQPNAAALAVNRIGGNDPSQILGKLLGNGRIVLINGNGILFGPDAKVNVGALIATTNDAANGDILSGKAVFDRAGNPNAMIVNQGRITTAQGGMVGLIAPAVSNTGPITARLGTVQLESSNVFTVDFTGDGLVSFPVNANIVAAAVNSNGKPVEALVINDGKIISGTVVLSARAAADLVTNVISMKGEIVATAAHDMGGTVVFDAGQGSIVLSGAKIDASGAKGGGTIAVGGWNAASVIADQATMLDASAKNVGDGGAISIIAKSTTFQGTAKAVGGAVGGNGGTIETSGSHLDVAGAKVDASATHGAIGSWLLDPENVTIANTATANGALASGTFAPSGDNSVIAVADLQNALATANVTIITGNTGSQAGDIEVSSNINWNSASSLTLKANRNITVDNSVAITNAGSGGLTLYADAGAVDAGTVTFGAGANAHLASGNLNVYYTPTLGYAHPVDYSGVLVGSGTATGYMLVDNSSDLQAIGTGDLGTIVSRLSQNYALNADIDISGVTSWNANSWTPLGMYPGQGDYTFTGMFDGQGHTISGLHIDVGGVNDGVGLFRNNAGTIKNLNLTGASVSVGCCLLSAVGVLAGVNSGSISNVSASGAVTGAWVVGGLVGQQYAGGTISDSHASVQVSTYGFTRGGGLVGDNAGAIRRSSATGDVGAGSYGVSLGGLVGQNDATGTIAQSYATGTVALNSPNGGNSTYIGGFVGYNSGAISQSYATGAVSFIINDETLEAFAQYGAGAFAGTQQNTGSISEAYATGLVHAENDWVASCPGCGNGPTAIRTGFAGYPNTIYANDRGGSFTSTYLDSSTTGLGGGLTTAQLQSALPTGFDPAVWGVIPGTTYPYLNWQFPNGPHVVSGTVYSDLGVTPVSGAGVTLLDNGNNVGTAIAGASGYYYFVVPDAATSDVLAYVSSGGSGSSFDDALAPKLDIYANYVRLNSAASTYSGTVDDVAAAVGSFGAQSGLLFTLGAKEALTLASGKSLEIDARAANFALDRAIDAGANTLVISSTGNITQSQPLIAANLLLEGTDGVFALTNAGNDIDTLAANTGSFTLADSDSVSVGTVNGTVGVHLSGGGDTTINASNAIAVTQPIVSTGQGSLTLHADASATDNGTVTFSGAGAIDYSGNTTGSVFIYYHPSSYPTSFDYRPFVTIGNPQRLASPMLVDNAADVQAMSGNLFGSYLLNKSIDLSSIANFAPIGNGTTPFAGIIDGNGFTLSNLTINSSANYTGFVGVLGVVSGAIGTLRNLTLTNAAVTTTAAGSGTSAAIAVGANPGGQIANVSVTGTVTGSANYMGAIQGRGNGTIVSAWAQATINANSNNALAGGLVGGNGGDISNSSANSLVIATGNNAFAGGLAGVNGPFNGTGGTIEQSVASGATEIIGENGTAGGFVGSNGGAIQQSYALGVTYIAGNSGQAGGLAGANFTSISQSFAAGAVDSSGPTFLGGLVGGNDGGTVTSSYWDIDTTGRVAGPGIGLTTAQLQSALPAGFSSSAWSIIAGTSFPYLNWQFAGTPQVVSGSVFTSLGGPTATKVKVSAVASAHNIGSTYSGENGYFYLLEAPGTVPASGVAVYAPGQSVKGIAFQDASLSTTPGQLNIDGNTAHIVTADVTYSQAVANLGTALGAFAGTTDVPLTVAGGNLNTGGLDLFVDGRANALTVDRSIVGAGSVFVASAGDLTIAPGNSVSAAGSNTAVTLSAAGNFINQAASGAIATPSGRWLVYSSAPANDVFGGLDSANTAIWNGTLYTLSPLTLAQTGNRYIFAQQPTLTFTSTDASKTYGSTADVSADYSVSGISPGIAGAFLADTAATVFSGAPELTSAGTAASASVAGGPYAITVANGTLTALDGYALAFNGAGHLTVNPKTLTVALAGSVEKTYDGTTAASLASGNYTLTGIVGSDVVSLSNSSSGNFDTMNAGTGKTVSVSGLSLSGAGASNYALAATSLSGAIGIIDPATLGVVANAQSKVYGATDPALTYAASGFAGSDNLALLTGSLARTDGENVGTYAINAGSLSAGPNYTIAYTGANLKVTPAPLAVVANAQNKVYGATDPALTYAASGFAGSDNLALLTGSLARTAGENVGTYAINAGSLSAGANYSIAYTSSNLTVSPAPLTVTVADSNRDFGAANPPFSDTVSGFKFNDDAAVLSGLILSTDAVTTSPVGTYSITSSGGTATNYIIATRNDGVLTVNVAANFSTPGYSSTLAATNSASPPSPNGGNSLTAPGGSANNSPSDNSGIPDTVGDTSGTQQSTGGQGSSNAGNTGGQDQGGSQDDSVTCVVANNSAACSK